MYIKKVRLPVRALPFPVRAPPLSVRAPPGTVCANPFAVCAHSLPYSCYYTNFLVHGVEVFARSAGFSHVCRICSDTFGFVIASIANYQPFISIKRLAGIRRAIRVAVILLVCFGVLDFGGSDLQARPEAEG